jgi:hypothetical protein
MSGLDRRRTFAERGQVVVLFALLLPVILTIGSVVVSVGNWYVLKRHLQTQVDAAALAGGGVFNGCQENPVLTRDNMENEALKFAGDTQRPPVPAPPASQANLNLQPEDWTDVRVALNSNLYWSTGDPTDGSTLDWTMGEPCATKSFEVKATDDKAPLLFRWIPLHPSLKARALVEAHPIRSSNGVRPIGVPEFEPVRVAALFVDEGVSGASNPSSISGRGFIIQQSLPSGDPLAQWNTWRGIVSGVNLNNTSNHSVVILTSRDPGVDLNYGNGSLQDVCNQNVVQTHCFGGGGLNDGLSFIHIYSGTGGGINPPAPRDVTLSGGCPSDLSRPYFNLDGMDSGVPCTLTVTANVDFGTGGADPTGPPTCARLAIAGGSSMSYVSGDTWVGTYTFPSAPAGRFLVDLDWTTRKSGTGPCSGGQTWSGTLQDVAGAYVGDAKSDVVEYLTLENVTAGTPTTDGNSWPKTVSADVQVTVGFVPPLRDLPLNSPPVRLRFDKGPSQTQALDCGTGSSPGGGWNGRMGVGCDPYQVNVRTPNPNCTPWDLLTPPDCIASENGNFNAQGIYDSFSNPCTPNNWDGVTMPPDADPRWIPLFILDERSTSAPGKTYYPIRRFAMFYLTAGDGLASGNKNGPPCPGDVPSRDLRGTRELWGHFKTYFTPGFGETTSEDEFCPDGEAALCVVSLVE